MSNTIVSQRILDDEINLITPDKKQFPVRLISVTTESEDDEIFLCKMTFVVPFTTLKIIETNGYFNMPAEKRGQNFGTFKETVDIEIEAALNPSLLDGLLTVAQSPKEIGECLTGANNFSKDSPLFNTESWFGFYVKQQIKLPKSLDEEGANVKIGYKTTWALESENSNEAGTEQEEALPTCFDQVVAFLQSERWGFQELRDKNLLRLEFEGVHGNWDFFIEVNEDTNQYCFYSIYPEIIDEDKRSAIAEKLVRINFGLLYGFFEMDLDKGKVQLKTVIPIVNDDLYTIFIKKYIHENNALMDKHFKAFKSI